MGPVLTGKRLKNNGQWLNWELTDPDFYDRALIPFLISWGQEQHPASSLPYHAQLISVRIIHPRPMDLRFMELLSDFEVVFEEGEEALSLEIESKRGVLRLSTQSPYYQLL
jgi:hypothetical protein